MRRTVAIVGRPNVGKSTLFNRLVGKRLALVDDTPGVTRDWRQGDARIGDLVFTAIDTAGLEPAAATGLDTDIRAQTEWALDRAGLVLMVIDARAGVTPVDRHFAAWLRRRSTPVILVANKAEGAAANAGLYEAYELGFGEPVPISAEHGEGMGLLHEALTPHLAGTEAEPHAAEADDEEQGPLQLAIVGRPNVGKSTLLNRLIGDERVLTGPEPGITRDAIAVEWTWGGRQIRLIDTAGLRRRARVVERVERLSVKDTLHAVRFAHVVVLVVDATEGLDRQDLAIGRMVIDEGRALVVAANKWDLVEDPARRLAEFQDRLAVSLPQVKGLPLVAVSALTGRRLDRMLEAVAEMYELWNRRVPTPALNRWLSEAVEQHPPPMVGGRRLRLRYATQIKRRPPTFLLFCSRPSEIPDSYLRYLVNGLRDAFGLLGVPIRLTMRAGRNPYIGEQRH